MEGGIFINIVEYRINDKGTETKRKRAKKKQWKIDGRLRKSGGQKEEQIAAADGGIIKLNSLRIVIAKQEKQTSIILVRVQKSACESPISAHSPSSFVCVCVYACLCNRKGCYVLIIVTMTKKRKYTFSTCQLSNVFYTAYDCYNALPRTHAVAARFIVPSFFLFYSILFAHRNFSN